MEAGADSDSDSDNMMCMAREQFHIRDLTTADVDQYDALLRYAFQVTDPTSSEMHTFLQPHSCGITYR